MTRVVNPDGEAAALSRPSGPSLPAGGRPSETSPETHVAGGGIGLLPALNAALRHWRALIVIPFVFAVVAAGISLAMQPTYRATAIFVPENSNAQNVPAGLAGFAGQFGLNLGGGTRSAEFYSQVAKSRDILAALLDTEVADHRTAAPADSVTILEQLEVAADSGGLLERGIETLSRMIAIDVDLPTGIVRVTTTSAHAGLAADVSNRLVELVDEFNTSSRQSQARRRREFVEARMQEAALALRQAEERLDSFHLRNRAWQQSPALVSEEARISRQVDIHRESYLLLSRGLEQARIEEVNDAPVISIVQHAAAPRYRAHPRRSLMVILAGALGVAVALGWIALVETFAHLRRVDAPGYRELAARLQIFGRRHGRAAAP